MRLAISGKNQKEAGFRQYQLHVKDLKTGKALPDTVPRVTSVAWAADNKTMIFTQEDKVTKRSDRILRITLGSAPVELYYEPVAQYAVFVGATRDKKFIVANFNATDTNEVRLLPAGQPQGSFRPVLGREKGHRYFVDHRAGERQEVVGGFDASRFETRRMWVTARDGVKVPLWAVCRNGFNDFVDSADFLVREKWTSPDRLIIQGGSAGGLLMGAVVNMRPELFRAVHAAAPFVYGRRPRRRFRAFQCGKGTGFHHGLDAVAVGNFRVKTGEIAGIFRKALAHFENNSI